MTTEIRINSIWSWIYNKTIALEKRHFRGRFAVSYFLKWLRQHKINKTKKFTDLPLVSTKIEGQNLIVPLAHNLAFYKERYKQYDKHIIQICQYVQSLLGDLAFIDVGANVGDTVINLGIIERARYLCIEGDEFYYNLLNCNLANYKYAYKAINCFLTDEIGAKAHYQVEHAVSSAKLTNTDVPQNGGGGVFFKRLDDIVEGEGFVPNILKIDTDGFDFKVLRGCNKILQDMKPVIFFEWWSIRLKELNEDPVSIFDYLRNFGYQRALFFDNYGKEFVSLALYEKDNLRTLSEYSCDLTSQIRHYDVLLFHEKSQLSIDGFRKWIDMNP